MPKRKDSRGRVLRNGEYQRKNGKYEYRTTFDGKTYSVSANSLDELRQKEEEIATKKVDQLRPRSITLSQAMSFYLEEAAVKPITLENYSHWAKSVNKKPLSKMKVDAIKKKHCLEFIRAMLTSYSSSYTLGVCNFVRSVFNWAILERYINKNPFGFEYYNYIDGLKPYHRRGRISEKQWDSFQEFLELTEEGQFWKPVLMLVYETGLRRGELCALTHEDIDLEKRILTVSKQIIYLSGKYIVSPPKSAAGYRIIPLTEEAIRNLHIILGRSSSGRIIVGRSGKPINPNGLIQCIIKLRESYNRSHPTDPIDLSLHVLRHTFCSRMAENNVNVKNIQEIMGHSTPIVSLSVYSHTNYDHKAEDFLKKMK